MARTSNASDLGASPDAGALVSARPRIRHLVGLSFTVPELMIMSAWAEYHGLRMSIELDTCVEGAVYEEVVAFYAPGMPLRRWTLWRTADAIVAEALHGAPLRSDCVGVILEMLASAVPCAA
jgi:hypothetical protein